MCVCVRCTGRTEFRVGIRTRSAAEIGRKINSKTICRIKNLFVTRYVHDACAAVCARVFLPPYIFSLSPRVHGRRGVPGDGDGQIKTVERRRGGEWGEGVGGGGGGRDRKNKRRKTATRPGQQQNSVRRRSLSLSVSHSPRSSISFRPSFFLRPFSSPGTNVLFSLSPLFFRTINYLRDQWRKINRRAGRNAPVQARGRRPRRGARRFRTRHLYAPPKTVARPPRPPLLRTGSGIRYGPRAGGGGSGGVGGSAGQSTDPDGSPRTFFGLFFLFFFF